MNLDLLSQASELVTQITGIQPSEFDIGIASHDSSRVTNR